MTGKQSIWLLLGFLFVVGPACAELEFVGPLTPEAILQKIPEWKPYVEGYSPQLDIVSRLQAIPEEVRIEIFLGTWCTDCRQHISAYFKIMDMVRNPMIQTSYIGVPRDRSARKAYIEGKNIERLPTFIVFIRDQEVGRIIETPSKSVEQDLWEILKQKLVGN